MIAELFLTIFNNNQMFNFKITAEEPAQYEQNAEQYRSYPFMLQQNPFVHSIQGFNQAGMPLNSVSSPYGFYMFPMSVVNTQTTFNAQFDPQIDQNKSARQEEIDRLEPINHNITATKKMSKETINKKDKLDPEYNPKRKKLSKSVSQIPGRNSHSNIYRAFIKSICNKTYKKILEKNFQKIKIMFQLNISIDDFQENIISRLPSFTNYINKSEFETFYCGNRPENTMFRILFDHFMRVHGQSHILTVPYKKKMKKESIIQFLSGIRYIVYELNPKQEK